MTKRRLSNVAASFRAKLLAQAQERGEDFQYLLNRWVIERFLYRLSVSRHRESFVLKGATLFLAWNGSLHRPTKDLDLLGFGNSAIGEVVDRIREICSESADDGLDFEAGRIEGGPIKEDAEYEGVRVRVPVVLDRARVVMQIDIGFGDAVDPNPVEVVLPTVLALDAPKLRGYPPEVVIAEKFHAMTVLGIANSRMKDFYDVWVLGSSREFAMAPLAGSIRSTFDRRRTPIPTEAPMALTAEFLEDGQKQTQWRAFGRRLGLREMPSLGEAGQQIGALLVPVLKVIRDGAETSQRWTAGGPWVSGG